MKSKHLEIRFEEAIEASLKSAGGYRRDSSPAYDAELALFPDDVVAFVQATQKRKWQSLFAIQGTDAGQTLVASLVKELAAKGSLYVLRHGFKCFGKTFQLAAFAPASGMNPETLADYDRNIVRITRQVHFSPKNPKLSLDLVISVNGLPVATLELKNPLSGQNVENAKFQYQFERDPVEPIFRFKERALVHFAVDPDLIFMTTRLAKKDTVWFPFNQGYQHGAGNPPRDDNYRTAYLWEEVLTRGSMLDILARFVHHQVVEKQLVTDKGIKVVKKETMIFPRYHQLEAVRKLVGNAEVNGTGHNYLVQHSAGSGKSNSIAWLAHHLSTLHNTNNEKVFHSVVVITDRRVLDKQLQDTVYQFEHKRGVVEKIDENTRQLAKALADGVPIIITTIQKFPFIAQALETLAKKGDSVEIATAGKRYAVIVDEAHSSQSGETSMELRKILNKESIEAALAEQMLDLEEEALSDEAKEEMLREMLKRPRQPNLSFFAFTATPKFKTKALFNEPGPDGRSPFHLYSMRQAIEENFIHDVLANYTTYKAYFGLIQATKDDPLVPKREAAKALARFLKFHPTNLRQKVEVIVEHFRQSTRHKIGGRAKAMVVTDSRKQAVRYKLAFDAYCREKGYADIKSLVAFSGEVGGIKEAPGKKFTEVGMNNGISERTLPEKFAGEEYQVLLVAEKYQTGFDQPLLHSMYVDKRLAGVQAVQTLSRLNRTTAGKSDTFVLDFVNEREEIFKAFKPYYEFTEVGEMPDSHQLYELQHKLEESRVINLAEVNAFCEVWFRNRRDNTPGEHKQLDAIITKAVERYKGLADEAQEDFKGKLVSFRNLYVFLSQIIPYQDSDLEKLYTYARFLLLKLPRRTEGKGCQLEDEVALKFYRLEKISDGAIDLSEGKSEPLKGPTQVGTAGVREDEPIYLSTLIEKLNEMFGTSFTAADELFFKQVAEAATENATIREAARVNTLENFRLVFERLLEGIFIERMEGNEEIFDRVMKDEKFRDVASDHLLRQVYQQAREGETEEFIGLATKN